MNVVSVASIPEKLVILTDLCLGPWIHAAWGLVMGYAVGSIPRTEAYLLEKHDRLFRTWERRKIKNEAISASTYPQILLNMRFLALIKAKHLSLFR